MFLDQPGFDKLSLTLQLLSQINRYEAKITLVSENDQLNAVSLSLSKTALPKLFCCLYQPGFYKLSLETWLICVNAEANINAVPPALKPI